jgi:hypothetical protein
MLPAPEEIPGIYRELGVKPKRGVWFSLYGTGHDGPCGCLVGVLAAKAVGVEKVCKMALMGDGFDAALEASMDRIIGMTDGFDGEKSEPFYCADRAEYQEGYQYGAKAWSSLVEAGMIQNP